MKRELDYFRDEVRNGFYIPTVVKQAWAMCLDILSEIDRICTKYDIKYYADWGTFLGAVRHGGFVPWDDDMDICMKREDYIKFREVCDKELPAHYDIHDYERKEDHWLFLSRVVNNKSICYDEDYLESHYNFPWLAAVDIFVKDYLYRDPEKEKERDKDVLLLVTLADGIREKQFKNDVSIQLREVEKKYNVKLPDISKERELGIALYKLAEKRMGEVKESESDEIGQIYPWILRGDKGQPKNYYEDSVRLPFEDISISVPARYDEFLTHRYGNFCEIHKIWWAHTYPFFESQKKEMERVNGAPIIDFTFDRQMLEKPKKDDRASLKTTAKECLTELARLLDAGSVASEQKNDEEYIHILTSAHQLTVDLGTLVEKIKGEDRDSTKTVIHSLESLCEAIFNSGSSGDISDAKNALKVAEKTINKYIIERKEILFLPIGPDEWKGLAPIYDLEVKKDEAEIYVVPLPLLRKDPLGRVKMCAKDIEDAVHNEDYPDGLALTSWRNYDPATHCPERIYIQNPYDRLNKLLTVPPEFYAKNIRRYTDELIFVPFSPTSEFEDKDMTDMYALKHYAVSPGVIYSDKALVQSENIKKHYVNKLTEFAGEDTRDIWEKKITTEGFPVRKVSIDKGAVICIGINELIETGEEILNRIKAKAEELKEKTGNEKISFTLYPDDRNQWKKLDENLSLKIFDLIEGYMAEGSNTLTLIPKEADDVAAEYSSYYGSASPLVPAFTIQGKPVSLFSGVKFNL